MTPVIPVLIYRARRGDSGEPARAVVGGGWQARAVVGGGWQARAVVGGGWQARAVVGGAELKETQGS